MSRIFIITILVTSLIYLLPDRGLAAEWQWSTEVKCFISGETNDHPHAFLWIPSNCKQVKGVILGQHNMLEEGILEDSSFREKMATLGIAEIWITPGIDQRWDPKDKSEDIFNAILDSLATISGYFELKYAPVIPIGHSAMATFPWNFAAYNRDRTLAILSIHGDAPSTNLTGFGRPNIDWTNLSINGIPGLMVEGEYEWWEARVQPALNYKKTHPKSCISFLCDAGRGHFDYSEQLVHYLGLFIEKAVKYRLPKSVPMNAPILLIPIDPEKGWLADRWRKDSLPEAPAAPYNDYKGNRENAFWYFDNQIAMETEKIYARQRGKKEQYIGFVQRGKLLDFNSKLHAREEAQFIPETDGITFYLSAANTDTMRSKIIGDHRHIPISITRICGPIKKINDTTFTLRFYRMGLNNQKRTNDLWLVAASNGGENFKSTVQQINIRIPYPNKEGAEQHISFTPLKNVKEGASSVILKAKTDSGMPVYYYIQEGPAEIVNGNQMVFNKIPPRSKYPMKITVIAWQYGRSNEPKIKTAEPVSQSFYVIK
ncbi:MAG TPA: hypothetical protein VIH57_13105 [Bacteroidales bacterium]